MQAKNSLAARLAAACFAIGLIASSVPAADAAETPKRGGTLTYLIPADAPPGLDRP